MHALREAFKKKTEKNDMKNNFSSTVWDHLFTLYKPVSQTTIIESLSIGD